MHSSPWRTRTTLAIAVTFAIGSCAPTPDQTTPGSTGSAAAGPAPQRGAGGTLNIRFTLPPRTLNGQFALAGSDAEAARLVLEPLARVGPDDKPIPVLAAEMPTLANGGISKDMTTVTWKLKPQVKWSDGTDFTSADVAFTYRFIADTASGAAAQEFLVSEVKRVEAVDDLTVRVTYTAPKPDVYRGFIGPIWNVNQERQFRDFMGAKARAAPGIQRPIGTGPYKVKEFTANVGVTFEINEYYRDPSKPFFKEVVVKGSGDPTSAARAVFQTGESDFSVIGEAVDGDALRRMIDSPDSKGILSATAGTVVERLAFNRSDPDPALGDMRSEPGRPHPFLSELPIRQALAMAVDRKAIAALYVNGLAAEPTCNILTGVDAYTSKNTASDPLCRYDLAAANRLLDEAGWVKGSDGIRQKAGVRLRMLFATTVDPTRQRIQEILKGDWSRLGVETELKKVVSGAFFGYEGADSAWKFFADVQMSRNIGWNPLDPTDELENWTTAQIKTRAANWSGSNYERWSNREYDDLFSQLRYETDEVKRRGIVIRMNDILVRDVAIVPLVALKALTGVAKSLKGFVDRERLHGVANWRR